MRYLDKFLKWLGFAMLLAPFIWYVACQFDEALDPAVQAVLNAEPPEPEGENGYYALVGMHASAETDDTHAYGRDLIMQFRQALAADPEMSEPYKFPKQALDFRGDNALLCAPRKSACLPNVTGTSAALDRALADNKLLLERYRALYRATHFVETLPPHHAAPFPDYPYKAHELLLAAIARDAANGRTLPALQALAADTNYWRMVLANARTLITKMVAVARIDGNYRLLAEIIATKPLLPADVERVQMLLVPLSPAERNMIEPMRWEFRISGDYAQLIKNSIREGIYGEDNSKKTPMRSALVWLAEPLAQENATRNLVYRHHMAVAALATAPTREFDARRDALAEQHAVKIDWHYLYNPLGKFMFQIGEPLWQPYIARLHDLDGYIHLVRLQLAVTQAQIAPPDVPAFLEKSGPLAADPYTGQLMEWDPEAKTLSFRARGARPKENPVLVVRVNG